MLSLGTLLAYAEEPSHTLRHVDIALERRRRDLKASEQARGEEASRALEV